MENLAIGFDLSFVDVLVHLLDVNDEYLDVLPEIGHHARNVRIERIAGGNGVNVASTLLKLGVEPILVVPADQSFRELLSLRGHTNIIELDASINTTIALMLKSGEIQINETIAKLGIHQWTGTIDQLWKSSKIKVILNIGLNPSGSEWINLQYLSACGVTFDKLLTENYEVYTKLDHTDYLILEPGSIKHHKDSILLKRIISHIVSNDNVIFLCNEEEWLEYHDIPKNKMIIHSPSNIRYFWNNESIEVPVPTLDCKNKNFVGAGDAFLAGIIESLINGENDPRLLINNAIQVAQNHICNRIH